ncbi:MAG TPA: bifunctional phosphopantothenoylcysteine decarboxylase/phosphopantothenate--cysteine ligase CoaBC, partial [Actinomycetes bacterium]|nr:bifunctional phosphopantothenoylcysteine decarboxylase/phosphopantothenate--cysteine ligase CoaBC [Actinomycetes bacterium]
SGHDVTVVPTAAALEFVGAPTWAALSGKPVAADVWESVHEVPHVRLGQGADLVVVAPATADLMARAAHGLADDLLTNTLLTARCPVVLAPAMHTEMWEHPATRANLQTLEGRGVRVVAPASGPLTSGDVGPGRLAELEDLVDGVAAALGALGDHPGAPPGPPGPGRTLAGTRVLISMGGTREPLDPVRYLGNRSSGRMGAAIAAEALRRGAEVTAVAAATTVDPPAGARVVGVETAQQLYDAVLAEAGTQDVIIMAAAVADFRPKRVAEGKLKKDQGVPEVVLEPTPDTLAELGRRRRPGQVLVGFAAETGDHLAGARGKLEAKRLDLVVLNHVEGARSAFGADDADAYLVDADTVEELPRTSKAAIAAHLLDRVEALRTGND